MLHASTCLAASLTSDPGCRVGLGALSSCVVPAARVIHIHHAGATKLLPYLSHMLAFSPASAWGHKEARWRPGWGRSLTNL